MRLNPVKSDAIEAVSPLLLREDDDNESINIIQLRKITIWIWISLSNMYQILLTSAPRCVARRPHLERSALPHIQPARAMAHRQQQELHLLAAVRVYCNGAASLIWNFQNFLQLIELPQVRRLF